MLNVHFAEIKHLYFGNKTKQKQIGTGGQTMTLKIEIEPKETIDNLTLASAIIYHCFETDYLDPVKVAKAILVDMEEE